MSRSNSSRGPSRSANTVLPFSFTWGNVPAGVDLADRSGDGQRGRLRHLDTGEHHGELRPSRGIGERAPLYAWPDVAIHLHVLPNGKVLTWVMTTSPDI